MRRRRPFRHVPEHLSVVVLQGRLRWGTYAAREGRRAVVLAAHEDAAKVAVAVLGWQVLAAHVDRARLRAASCRRVREARG